MGLLRFLAVGWLGSGVYWLFRQWGKAFADLETAAFVWIIGLIVFAGVHDHLVARKRRRANSDRPER